MGKFVGGLKMWFVSMIWATVIVGLLWIVSFAGYGFNPLVLMGAAALGQFLGFIFTDDAQDKEETGFMYAISFLINLLINPMLAIVEIPVMLGAYWVSYNLMNKGQRNEG